MTSKTSFEKASSADEKGEKPGGNIIAYRSDEVVYSSKTGYTPEFNYGKHTYIGEFDEGFSLFLDTWIVTIVTSCYYTLIFMNDQRKVVHKMLIPTYTSIIKLNGREVILDGRYLDKDRMFILNLFDVMKNEVNEINSEDDVKKLEFFKTNMNREHGNSPIFNYTIGSYFGYLEDNMIYYCTNQFDKKENTWNKSFNLLQVKNEKENKERKSIIGTYSKSYDEIESMILRQHKCFGRHGLYFGYTNQRVKSYLVNIKDDEIKIEMFGSDSFETNCPPISHTYCQDAIQLMNDFMIVPSVMKVSMKTVTDERTGFSRNQDVLGHKLSFYGCKGKDHFMSFIGTIYGYYFVKTVRMNDSLCIYNPTKKELVIIPVGNISKLFNDDYQVNLDLEGNQKIKFDSEEAFLLTTVVKT